MSIRAIRIWIVIFVVAGLSACGGAEGRKEKYLKLAEASFQKSDFEKARINYKNVLQIDPKDINGREGYARTLEKLRDWRGAVAQYQAVIQDYPDNTDAKIKLGQLYLLAKASDRAMKLADEVLAAKATDDGALALKAGALMQAGKIDEALVNADQAYKLNRDSIDNIVLLASIYGRRGRVDNAIGLLEKEAGVHPESNSIYTLLAQFYMQTQRTALAETALRKLVSLNPDVIGYKSELARFYDAIGRHDDAEQVLTGLVAAKPGDQESVFALQSFYMARKDWSKAEAVLKAAIDKNPDNAEFRFQLGGFYIARKQYDKARELHRDMLDGDKVTMLKAKDRLAYIDTLEGKIPDALARIAEVLQDNPSDVDALTLRGTIYLGQHKASDAINDLRTVENAKPDTPGVLKLLGQAHQLNGDLQQAVDLFKAALNLEPKDIPLRVRLSDLYTQLGDKEQATRQLELANKMVPKTAAIMDKLVQVYINGEYLDDAEDMVAQLRTVSPKSPRNDYYLGLINQARGHHEAALKNFDAALSLKPGAIEPMTAKVKSYIALKQIDQAVDWLDTVLDSAKDNPVVYNLKGELLLARKDWSGAVKAFEHSTALRPDWWVPYRNIALARKNQGGESGALQYLLSVVDKVDSAPLRIETANYAESVKQYTVAIAQYQKALEKNASNKVLMNNLAMLIITYQRDPTSMKQAEALSDALAGAEEPSFQDTAGWVRYNMGDYSRALPIIQQALRGAPENPAIQYHLGMTYLATNDRDNASRYLKMALASDKAFPGRDDAKKALEQMTQQG